MKLSPLRKTAIRLGMRALERQRFEYLGNRIQVNDDVLNPTAFRASLLFADAIHVWADVPTCKALELGCGAGLGSLVLAQRGHDVCSIDISIRSVANTALNSRNNQQRLQTLASNWDSALSPEIKFDLVVANPPFLPEKTPIFQTALYAGKGFFTFKGALQTIARRLAPSGRGILLTSEATGRDTVLSLLEETGLSVVDSKRKSSWGEIYFADLLASAPIPG